MKSTLSRFIHEEEGANLVEYALLTGLVALAAVGTLGGIATSVKDVYARIKTSIEAVSPPAQ
jgi:pilus assembly protein Flp/PilA